MTAFDYEKRYLKGLFNKRGAKVRYTKKALPQVNPQLHEWLKIFNESSPKHTIAQSDDSDKFSMRKLDDGTKYTLVEATEIKADGITDADSIGKKARIYMRQRYKGTVLPVGATKSAYVRRDGINEYTNPENSLQMKDTIRKWWRLPNWRTF